MPKLLSEHKQGVGVQAEGDNDALLKKTYFIYSVDSHRFLFTSRNMSVWNSFDAFFDLWLNK